MSFNSGNGGGISNASDVALSNPIDNDVLTFQSTTGKWSNEPSSSSGGLNDAGVAALVSDNSTDTGGALSATYLSNAIAGTNPQGASSTVADRFGAIEGAISAGAGDPGPAGAEVVAFGPVDDTTSCVTGDVYGPFLAPVAYTVLSPVAVALRGGAASGDTNFDIELCTTGIAGPWSSIFTTGKPVVAAGARTGQSTAAPATSTVPVGAGLRAKILSAPTAGGTMTWRTPAQTGNGDTVAVVSKNIPIPAGTVDGDLLTAVLFVSSNAPVWPSGWSGQGSPFPAGTDATLGPFYMCVATKVAGSSESTTQAVTFTSSPAVMITLGVAAGSLVVPAAPSVTTTAATTGITPSGVTTPVVNCFVVHLAAPRHTGGTLPGSITWDGSLTTDVQAATARTGSTTNFAEAVAHLTQVSAGAVTQRTATWSNTARNVMATLVFQPTSGSTATGPEAIVRLQPAA